LADAMKDGFKSLKELEVRNTGFHAEAAEKLKQSHPGLKVTF
jgi:hypothetical protein